MTGRTLIANARRLRRDRSGLALLEFALSMPLVLMAGLYGVETANLALVNLKISQITLNLADNASRVDNSTLSPPQLREIDLNDVLQAARYQGNSIQLTTRGRITISSLENIQQSYDTQPVQRIHWQRCLGVMSGTGYESSYGSATPLTTAGTTTDQSNAGVTTTGMGDAGSQVTAPSGGGVVFVEVNYNYKPLITGYLLGSATRIHYVASFIDRDSRDFSHIYNPSPSATASTCNLHTIGTGGATT